MARTFLDTIYTKDCVDTDTFNKDWTIPNGCILHIKAFDCSAPGESSIYVKLIWDRSGTPDEIVSSSSSAAFPNLGIERTGDGTKKLTIQLKHSNSAIGTVGLSGSLTAYYE